MKPTIEKIKELDERIKTERRKADEMAVELRAVVSEEYATRYTNVSSANFHERVIKAERLASKRAQLVGYITDKTRRAGKLLELRARLIADLERGSAI